jgi:hypothetical protein
MKIRVGLIAAASVVAVGAALLTGAAPASASVTVTFNMDQGGNPDVTFYMYEPSLSGGVNLEIESDYASLFSDINGSKWNGEPVYEWEDQTTGECLDAHVAANRLLEAPCKANDLNEEFWIVSNEMINAEETNLADGSLQCVNAIHAENGQQIDFETCNGNANQTWYY